MDRNVRGYDMAKLVFLLGVVVVLALMTTGLANMPFVAPVLHDAMESFVNFIGIGN